MNYAHFLLVSTRITLSSSSKSIDTENRAEYIFRHFPINIPIRLSQIVKLVSCLANSRLVRIYCN